MSSLDVENWMHATDSERNMAILKWTPSNAEGQEIVERVATLFKGECVYKVLETHASVIDNRWVIEAFSESDDYETLVQRENIEFLGFHIVFKHIDEYLPVQP